MKNLKSIVAIAFITVAFGSCADQKKTQAEKAVNNYVAYVDSVGNVASEDLAEKWDDVESDYIAKKIEAESALENLEDRMELDQKLEAGSKKYEEFKANLLAEKQKWKLQITK
jgi:histidinol dehydrogenase